MPFGAGSMSARFFSKDYQQDMLTTVESIATSVMSRHDDDMDEFDGIPPYQVR